eukprot:749555-Pelagomonas_calceolata.AAC.2
MQDQSLRLERLVRIFKRRAARVYATGCRAATEEAAKTGRSGVAAAAAAAAAKASRRCRGANFCMTLHQAEEWAQAKHAQHQQMEGGMSAPEGGSHSGPTHGSLSGLKYGRHTGTQHPRHLATLQDVEWAASVVGVPFQCSSWEVSSKGPCFSVFAALMPWVGQAYNAFRPRAAADDDDGGGDGGGGGGGGENRTSVPVLLVPCHYEECTPLTFCVGCSTYAFLPRHAHVPRSCPCASWHLLSGRQHSTQACSEEKHLLGCFWAGGLHLIAEGDDDGDDGDDDGSDASDRKSIEGWPQGPSRDSSQSRQRKVEAYIRPAWGSRKRDAVPSKQQPQRQHGRHREGEDWACNRKGAGKNGRLRVEHAKQKQRQEREEQRLQQYQEWQEQQQLQEELQEQQQAEHADGLQPEQLARFRQRPWRVKSAVDLCRGDEVRERTGIDSCACLRGQHS